ncbi:MAG: twin-arginine translocase TatA/TatE family subunit [Synergistaceae bacterium]|nr:twin-arginine translocase TatA/TatE family subunit [Synergistaceae bacterium]
MSIGWGEVLVVLFLILLLFGGKRLPELARSMGHAVNEFKRGLNSSVKDNVDSGSIKDKDEDS